MTDVEFVRAVQGAPSTSWEQGKMAQRVAGTVPVSLLGFGVVWPAVVALTGAYNGPFCPQPGNATSAATTENTNKPLRPKAWVVRPRI